MELYSEYDQPKTMLHTYCQQISSSQYEKQGAMETEKALQDLMDYLEKNPAAYKKVLVRRKQEEAENAGILSYMKCKVLATVRGPDYMQDDVTNEETLYKLGELQHEIAKAYNYGQDANNSKKRFSRRIAAKKAKAAKNDENTPPANFKKPPVVTSSRRKAPPPPPPPYPPPSISSPGTSDDEVFIKSILPITPCRRPALHPDDSSLSIDCSIPPPPPPPPANLAGSKVLKERTNLKDQAGFYSPTFKSTPNKPPLTPKPPCTPGIQSSLKRQGSMTSLSSIASMHDELLSFDKSRLKSVSKTRKSPSGMPAKTPQSKKRVLSATIARASLTDICSISTISAFNQQMVDKFRNARSPLTAVNSPASGFNSPASDFNSPTGFTP